VNVLIIGGGGREHAIAWKLRQSPKLGDLFVAPGNDGIRQIAECLRLTVPKPYADEAEAAGFGDAVVAMARERRVELVVVAPDDPLALGLVDRVEAAGLAAFGPSRAAARIESSKAFAKELMRDAGIPASTSARFDDYGPAADYVRARSCDVVVKADGLSVGKGAIVTDSHDEAIAALRSLMIEDALGPSGRTVVIEDRLAGRETSAHAFSDGRTVVHMPFSCDHKPVFDGNRGPNTGGMGVYSPPHWLGDATAEMIRHDITEAAVRAMADAGTPFKGVIYPGIMVTDEGPRVIEFNARFGDPEAETLLPLLETDLLEIMLAIANGTLHNLDVRWRDEATITVMLASGGYPGAYETGKRIDGFDALDRDVIVFHAGSRRESNGFATNGGRVLGITTTGATLAEAREKAYRNIERISFEGMHYRTDIGAVASGTAVGV
jgi:phosphoribosylamine--glycine ligase